LFTLGERRAGRLVQTRYVMNDVVSGLTIDDIPITSQASRLQEYDQWKNSVSGSKLEYHIC